MILINTVSVISAVSAMKRKWTAKPAPAGAGVHENHGKTTRLISAIDAAFFVFLIIALCFIIYSSSRANIQTDSVDYYAILQRLAGGERKPILNNLYFVDQRSPGYSIFSLAPYYFATFAIEPYVKTEEVIEKTEIGPPAVQKHFEQPRPAEPQAPGGGGGETMLIPSTPLLSRDIFFKNFYIEREGSLFEWKIIFALLFTSYALLFVGIFFAAKTLSLDKKGFTGLSLVMLSILTSGIFVHNIVNSPAYATLAAFGLSAVFCYFFVRSHLKKRSWDELLSGLFMGLLVLVRLETAAMFFTVLVFLLVERRIAFVKRFVTGFLLAASVFVIYNLHQFGTIINFAMLKGDINVVSFNLGYIFANLFDPSSGVVFFSPLIVAGIAGLFVSRGRFYKILAACCVILLALYCVRVPVMYHCVGEESVTIGGISVGCPKNAGDLSRLILFDINRYITVLAPFSFLGLRNLLLMLANKTRRVFKKGGRRRPTKLLRQHLPKRKRFTSAP
jgi:hypothetical protein